MSTKETTPKDQGITLTSKDGKRTWTTNDRAEITNLRAQGWSEDKTKADTETTPALAEVKAVAAPANKSASAKSK